MTSRRILDLSHPIRAGLVTYPGLPAPRIVSHLTREDSRSRYAPGTEFQMDVIEMIGNTGTYLDSPFHRYGEGVDLAGVPLERMVDLPTLVVRPTAVRAGERRGIGVADLAPLGDAIAGAAVLLETGWDLLFGTPAYGDPAPFLDAEGAAWLVEQDAALVGIDSLNIDDTHPDTAGERPAHSTLLAAGIPIVEHLTRLDALPERGARFTAAPPAVEGFGTFPVRAVAILG